MKTNKLATLTGAVFLSLSLTPAVNASDKDIAALTHFWQNPQKTEQECLEYYYYSDVITFYCMAQAYLDYQTLQTLSGLPVFLQGPHTKTQLELNNQYSFGHYNKDFVIWLKEKLLPATQAPGFTQLFKFFYNNYVKQTARTHYVVHEHLLSNPDYLIQEQQAYVRILKTQGFSEEFDYGAEYYHFAGLYEEDYDGSIVKQAVLFWIRRVTDGTEEAFFQGLNALLEIYDPDFLQAWHKKSECQSASTAKQLACQRIAYTKEMAAAEAELERVYRKLYAKRDTEGQAKLKKAQALWIEFRNANAVFLVNGLKNELQEAVSQIKEKANMTQERIKVLEAELETK